MQCPSCRHIEDKVVDSREAQEGETIRRRRECLKCGRRFTTSLYSAGADPRQRSGRIDP